jgi:hypothetical protein
MAAAVVGAARLDLCSLRAASFPSLADRSSACFLHATLGGAEVITHELLQLCPSCC